MKKTNDTSEVICLPIELNPHLNDCISQFSLMDLLSLFSILLSCVPIVLLHALFHALFIRTISLVGLIVRIGSLNPLFSVQTAVVRYINPPMPHQCPENIVFNVT